MVGNWNIRYADKGAHWTSVRLVCTKGACLAIHYALSSFITVFENCCHLGVANMIVRYSDMGTQYAGSPLNMLNMYCVQNTLNAYTIHLICSICAHPSSPTRGAFSWQGTWGRGDIVAKQVIKNIMNK